MELDGTINNINGDTWNDLHVLRIAECGSCACDAPPTKQQCSCGENLLTLSEYHIDKHLTGGPSTSSRPLPV